MLRVTPFFHCHLRPFGTLDCLCDGFDRFCWRQLHDSIRLVQNRWHQRLRFLGWVAWCVVSWENTSKHEVVDKRNMRYYMILLMMMMMMMMMMMTMPMTRRTARTTTIIHIIINYFITAKPNKYFHYVIIIIFASSSRGGMIVKLNHPNIVVTTKIMSKLETKTCMTNTKHHAFLALKSFVFP